MTAQKVTSLSDPLVPEAVKATPAWFRLIDQRNWYDNKSQHCQRWYKRLKITQVSLAVLVPATSLLPSDCAKVVSSLCGVLIAVLEAIQQMNQYSTLWVTYRATAERLKHEQYLFLSAAGPYKGMTDGDRFVALAERVEEHVSTEHANWFNEAKLSAFGQKTEGQ